jgi:large subunit ribosomal protein L10
MKREQKEALVEEMTSLLSDAEAIFAIDYRGISVPQAAELRDRLAGSEASFRVVKNRLARRAAESSGTEGLDELLEGPTALTLVKGDPVTAAKAISTFSREHGLLTYKGGIMEGAPLDPDRFRAIARLPGLEVLHGQLVGVTASPLTGLVRGLGAMLSGLALQLGQIHEKGLLGGEAEDRGDAEEEDHPAPRREAEDAAGDDSAEEKED